MALGLRVRCGPSTALQLSTTVLVCFGYEGAGLLRTQPRLTECVPHQGPFWCWSPAGNHGPSAVHSFGPRECLGRTLMPGGLCSWSGGHSGQEMWPLGEVTTRLQMGEGPGLSPLLACLKTNTIQIHSIDLCQVRRTPQFCVPWGPQEA